MTTIIYAHPWEESFNHAILEQVELTLTGNHVEYQVIDLYKDGFNPILTLEELKLYSAGKTNYALVNDYQKIIQNSDSLIFIFPIWWYDVPAILKGFFDKVMLEKFAFLEDEARNWTGLLTNIKKVNVITTASMTKELLAQNGDTIQNVLINSTLSSIGIPSEITKWLHFGNITKSTESERHEFLSKIGTSI